MTGNVSGGAAPRAVHKRSIEHTRFTSARRRDRVRAAGSPGSIQAAHKAGTAPPRLPRHTTKPHAIVCSPCCPACCAIRGFRVPPAHLRQRRVQRCPAYCSIPGCRAPPTYCIASRPHSTADGSADRIACTLHCSSPDSAGGRGRPRRPACGSQAPHGALQRVGENPKNPRAFLKGGCRGHSPGVLGTTPRIWLRSWRST